MKKMLIGGSKVRFNITSCSWIPLGVGQIKKGVARSTNEMASPLRDAMVVEGSNDGLTFTSSIVERDVAMRLKDVLQLVAILLMVQLSHPHSYGRA